MDQTATIKFNTEPEPKQKTGRKFLVGLLVILVAVAGFSYWWFFMRGRTPAAPGNSAPAATAPATVKEAQSAKVQPATKPVAQVLPAKRISIPPAAAIAPQAALAPRTPPPVLTDAQKRLKVAQDGFDQVMAMAVQRPDTYGFLPDDDLGKATLGGEIPIYTIKPLGHDKFANQQVNSLLQPLKEWFYPVILQNHVRFLVRVRYDNHDYAPGDGSRALAMSYDKILANWPPEKGFHPKLITVPNLPAYYFTVPELPKPNITDTDRMLDYTPDLSPASIVLANCQ